MALQLDPVDEIICHAFTYVATSEVVDLFMFNPVLFDLNAASFNIKAEAIENAITQKISGFIYSFLRET